MCIRDRFSAGASEIEKLDSTDIYEVAKKLSKGLLMGARGNSGVILSQIFRGVSMAFEGKKEVNAVELAQAFKNGAKVAYKAAVSYTHLNMKFCSMHS